MEENIGNWGIPSITAITSLLSYNRNKRIREEVGITNINGFEGIEGVIPHQYSRIEIGGKYLTCHSLDKKTVYTKGGKLLFGCTDFKYYNEGMFLVGNKIETVIVSGKRNDEFGYALYNEENKQTEAIFKPYGWSEKFNESGFLLVNIFGEFKNSSIINKSGDIVFQSDSYDSPYLKGVICIHNNKIINLLTGNVICKKSYGSGMDTDEFMFVQVDSNCIYQINKSNGEFIIHGVEKKVEEPKKIEHPIKIAAEPQPKKQSRNEQCACGSGNKFKNCCLNK